MEKISRKQASKIAATLGYDSEKEAVIAYGLIAIVQTTITVVLALLLGLLVGAPVEALIVCFSVSALRKYSGGAHAQNAEYCTLLSVLYCTFAAMLSHWIYPLYSFYVMLAAIAIVYGASLRIVWLYAPVDSANKPIRTQQKRKRMRKGSYILLGVYLTASVLFLLLGIQTQQFRTYGISLLLGVGWQVITLTSLGSILLNKLNVLPKYLRKEKTS
jgi:accessory gene regulator B